MTPMTTATRAGLDKLANPALLKSMSIALGKRGEPNASLYMAKAATAIETLLARIAALESERVALREALEPFATKHFMGDMYVQFAPWLLEAARAALKENDDG